MSETLSRNFLDFDDITPGARYKQPIDPRGRKRILHLIEDGVEMAWCGWHKEFHPVADFAVQSNTWDGLSGYCRLGKQEDKESRNPGQTERRQLRKLPGHAIKVKMVGHARRRARQRNLPFALTVSDIKIPDYCPALGLKLQPNKGHPGPSSPSLDRIYPAKGYVPGNVQVISQQANLMKQDATPEQLRNFAKWVMANYGEEVDNREVP